MTTENTNTASINIFELASRTKVRFDTTRGEVMIEQLWDMPLTSKTGFDLDSVGQLIVSELELINNRSLVNTSPNPRAGELTLKLDLIKHVIAVKQQENAERAAKAERAEKRKKLIDLLDKKQDEAMGALSVDEIKAQLTALDD
jgi:hypothetical protein